MLDDSDPATSLCEAIVNSSFPQSEQLLTSDLSSEVIASLLSQISQTRRELSDEIGRNSKDEAGNVDKWISQAKKAQEDIARCKSDSKRIVEEYEQLQAFRDRTTDHQHKIELLETEIDFANTLDQELQNVSLETQSLREVEEFLLQDDPYKAAGKLQELDRNSTFKSNSRTTILLRDLKDELRLRARLQLEAKLNAQILARREPHQGSLEVIPSELDPEALNSDVILRGLDDLGEVQDSLEPLTDKFKSLIVHPLRRSARMRLSAYRLDEHDLRLDLGTDLPPIDLVLDFVCAVLDFLRTRFSKTIQRATTKALLPISWVFWCPTGSILNFQSTLPCWRI